jgi:hypothetical protein
MLTLRKEMKRLTALQTADLRPKRPSLWLMLSS